MLVELRGPEQQGRRPHEHKRLWHKEREHSLSIGCANCLDKKLCGGLEVDGSVFDCMALCCGEPERCDSVCRQQPLQFVRRVREVGGFGLENVPRARKLASPSMPILVPTLLHGKKRSRPFNAPTVCLPLYEIIAKHGGQPRYTDFRGIAHAFKVSAEAQIILTGTAIDAPLERWWSLGEQRRRDAIRALMNLNIKLVTTPNFSLFTDRPRWDDLHSIKRIALVQAEFAAEGLVAALHLNARTDRDWARWEAFVRERPEISHVAFEFATGAGYGRRILWHAKHLEALASSVGRPLHLVVRGGARVLSQLARAFAGLTILETSAFVKTIKRQRGTVVDRTKLHWAQSPTRKNEPLDKLLDQNWREVTSAYTHILS